MRIVLAMVRDMLNAWLDDLPVTKAELATAVNNMDTIRRDRRLPMWHREQADMLMFMLEGELRDKEISDGD